MNAQRNVLTILVLSFMSIVVVAQDAQVVYMEGEADLFRSGRWVSVDIGDTLPGDARLRLTDGAYVEVLQGSTMYRFDQSGEVRLEAPPAGHAVGTDVSSILSRTVRRLTVREASPGVNIASGGVRASEAATQPEIEWAGDESPEELIQMGLADLSAGDVQSASYSFDDAYAFATGETVDRAGFYLAYSLYLLGDTAEAQSVLSETDPPVSSDYFRDYALLVGELFAASDPPRAASVLRTALRTHADLEQRDPMTAQALLFLLGTAEQESDPERSASNLRRAIRLAPGTALATQARAMLP
jgi:hypothetical protein